LNIWTFWGQKNSLTCSKNKSSFFTQEWFKLGLDCHATGLCTLDLFKISIISVWYVDMMVQHAWWIMSKLTNTKSKLCPYHGDPCTKLKHVVHPWKVQLLCPPSEDAPLHKRLFVLTHDWLHCTTYYYECNTVVPWRLQRKLNKCWKFPKKYVSKRFYVFLEEWKWKIFWNVQ